MKQAITLKPKRLIHHFCHLNAKFVIAGMLLLYCIAYAQAQSCPGNPGNSASVFIQYKVTGAAHSKCGYDEFLHWDLPRDHIYHNRITTVGESYSFSWSDNNGCDSSWTSGGGDENQEDTASPGPYWGHENYSFGVTHYESITGINCDYTNSYSGGWTSSGESHDSRLKESNNSNGPFVYFVTNYNQSYNNTMTPAYTIGPNGTMEWCFVENDSTTGSYLKWVTSSWNGADDDFSWQEQSLDASSISTNTASLDGGGTPTTPTHEGGDLSSTNGISIPTLVISCLTNPTTYVDTKGVAVDLSNEYTDDELRGYINSLMPPYMNGEVYDGGWGSIEDSWYTQTSDDDWIFYRCSYSLINSAHTSGLGFLWNGQAELQKGTSAKRDFECLI